MSLWSCKSCSKSFTRKGDLTRHELLHTGIKPHVCKTCGKGFAQASGLKTHLNVHSKEKPYKCGIGTCKKAFGDPSSRARHRKETHSREGAYKCIITHCGTRIKRRSAFVAHLRRHGLDPSSLDIDAIASQRGNGAIPAPICFAPPEVQNKSHNTEIESRSVPVSPPFLGDNYGYLPLAGGGEGNHFMDDWLGDHPFDCRGVDMSPAHDTLLPMLDQTVNIEPSIPHGVQPYLSSDFQDPFYFDGIFTSTMDTSFLSASPLSLPVLDPFLEAGMDGSSSSWPSPSSTYSSLYTTDLNDDVVSLANNASQESLLYNIM